MSVNPIHKSFYFDENQNFTCRLAQQNVQFAYTIGNVIAQIWQHPTEAKFAIEHSFKK